MPGLYKSYMELKADYIEGRDFKAFHRDTSSPVFIMAPHGGKIELFTTDLAREIAGEEFSFYSFEGISHSQHITSHLFDEPLALEAVVKAEVILAIHGEKSADNQFLMIGGLDSDLCFELNSLLVQADFPVREVRRDLQGRSATNICNRSRRGMGAQLELSYALRKSLMEDLERKTVFVQVIRTALFNLTKGF